ncbi:MAG: type II toxin-antitoxin system mRNA interferase toxin, RelE/StbE family [Patescibacteria group bacterium]
MKKTLKRIDYSKTFDKQPKKAQLSIKIAFRNKFETFLINPFHPQLNNHPLSGNYKGYRSINITGDWRALYSENKVAIIFELLGTHSQLYK